MQIWNTLSGKKEEFKPIKKNSVGLYTCGPTVYNYAHIGNLRTYIFEDVLQRTLEWNGYKVKRVMNITDVGHLTSDADEGEDKLEKEAKKEKRSVWDIAKYYTIAFLRDIDVLNIKRPKYIAPATKFIPDQIKLIQILFKNGYAYETAKAIYFDVSKFKEYTKLSHQKLSEKITAAREGVVSDENKRNPQDFVLWFKLVDHFKNHVMRWPSPWGEGFPGWHIECSAISTKFLGQPFDIHTGGVDHISVHHTDEIAQSEGAYKKPLARYWMHGEFLVINSERMGKSVGNFLTLETLRGKNIDPLAYRYLVLSTHYRSQLNFNWEAINGAMQAMKNLKREIAILKSAESGENGHRKEAAAIRKRFADAVNDDLNTPQAIAILWKTVKDKVLTPKEKLSLIMDFDEVLGLALKKIKKFASIPPKIRKLAEERELCRTHKQFVQSDALREKIRVLGYSIEDTPTGPFVYKS